MALSNPDQEIVRQYLLGQLTDDEQLNVEGRLLTEDDFFEELEITKDELVEEYLAKELTQTERERFEQNFLASPEGKQRQVFARTLNRYVLNHAPPPQKNRSWAERLAAFWNVQPSLLRVASAIAAVVIVMGIFWLSRAPSPQTFASLTLTNTSSTRSSGNELPRVKLKEDALRLTLMLPTPATSGVRYRVVVRNDNGVTQTSDVASQDSQSVSVVIPAAQLSPGQYAVTLSAIGANDTVQRIPGSYSFAVE